MHSLARKLALLGLVLALPAAAQDPSTASGLAFPLDDPEHLKVLEQLDEEPWYQSSEDYARYARETLQKERALIERLGLLAK